MRIEFIALVLILLLCVIMRMNVLDVPLNRDEGGFAYFGTLLHQGGALYQDGFDHKPPAIWLWYWLLNFIMDFEAIRLHVFLLVYNLATLILVITCAQNLYSVAAGLWAGLIYAMVSGSWQVEGFSASAEMFMLLPIMGSLVLCLLGMERGRGAYLAASGFLTASYVWTKQPALAIGFFLVLYILIASFTAEVTRQSPVQRGLIGIRRVFIFCIGFVVPSFVLCGYFIWTGRWNEFLYWSFTHSLDYAGSYSFSTYLIRAWNRVTTTVAGNPCAWILAIGTCLIMPFYRSREGLVLAGFFVSSLLSACHSVFMYRHYMALVVPSLALAAGVGAAVLVGRFKNNNISHAVAVILLIFGVSIGPLINDRDYYVLKTGVEISRKFFGANPFPESPVIAAYIRDRTTPRDPVLILGSEPQILVLAARPSATRHLFMYQVVGPFSRAAEFQQDVLDDIERNRPAYVVNVKLGTSWLNDPKTSEIFLRDILGWLTKNYSVEAIVRSGDKTPVLLELGQIDDKERMAEIARARVVILKRHPASGTGTVTD